MNLNTLMQVRQQIWHCFSQSRDALFELVDALSSEDRARSLPELSLSPLFRRRWGSVYEALEDGKIDQKLWSEIWAAALLAEQNGPVWVSIDTTSIARPEAETSPDRGMIYVPNLPHATKPVSVGWQFSTLMLLPQEASSWGAILSQRRVSSDQTAVAVAIEQLEELIPLLPEETCILADRWYGTAAFVQAVSRLRRGALLRLKRNRKLYRPASPKQPGERGRTRLDGPLFQGSRIETWGEPESQWQMCDEQGNLVMVQAWSGLHFQKAREVSLTVFRVLRTGAKGTRRDPRESWFVWLGPDPLPLSEVIWTYKRRFSHEHTYRFLKQDLFWTKVGVRTPSQFERWSLVVATAMNLLVLARKTGQALYRPWERRREVITPRQVRRVMAPILMQIGTPAHPPKLRGKSPGRPKGFRFKALSYPVVRKRPKRAQNTS